MGTKVQNWCGGGDKAVRASPPFWRLTPALEFIRLVFPGAWKIRDWIGFRLRHGACSRFRHAPSKELHP
jgi:hypothetical protein